jgi:Flp pilus assembly pilin Flp
MNCLTLASLLSVRQLQERDMRTSLLLRWLSDESGQDIIEYALLCSFLGFGAIAGINFLRTAMHDSYLAWDAAGQSDRLVEPQPPTGP